MRVSDFSLPAKASKTLSLFRATRLLAYGDLIAVAEHSLRIRADDADLLPRINIAANRKNDLTSPALTERGSNASSRPNRKTLPGNDRLLFFMFFCSLPALQFECNGHQQSNGISLAAQDRRLVLPVAERLHRRN